MLGGLHVYIDEQGMLVRTIIDEQSIRRLQPGGLVDFLIGYVEYDFTSLWRLILALRESPIFDPVTDIHFADYEACKNGCELIAEGLEEPVGAYFVNKALENINGMPDNGSASFWIYQAERMVDALAVPIITHTFICRAFERLYASDGATMERINRLFKAYPELRGHIFAETFSFEASEDEQGNDICLLKKEHIISTCEELFFFCLLELIRRDVRISRCECCGQYFVPKTKKKTLYCDRVIRDGKTCKEIAPKLKQKKMESSDSALKEYIRLYKMYYSRAERYESRKDLSRERTPNDLNFDEFYLWAARAGVKRRRYVAGEITAEEFLIYIKRDHLEKTHGQTETRRPLSGDDVSRH